MDFPSNSKASGPASEPPKRVERVVSADATRRKKSLGRQFQNTFFNGSAKMAIHYMFFNVMIPAAKDALVEAGAQGMEKLVYGESKRSRPPGAAGPMGHIAYNRIAQRAAGAPGPPRQMSQRARQQHDFDEILISSRREAEDVIERMFDLVSKYEAATVADLYELTGLSSTHTDHKWGWTDLRGTQVRRVRNDGYLLDLPEPEFLD